ncbi:potassium transporter peripheral membrane component [Salinarchaeum sp. Harcht-Bsk1]|uniref:Trk system potassium transporter TrkA n=1 Tax=Salinarchaeum sp. Harcht-Bsk1 TaxID=1333523 RepID=UPI0003422D23|nr:Trk system potassium transporter TrkA [Salinarchaeum sp. Harcht-Bsk1]AGN02479.1 potassium transporter peripheral membrane component [Salinarchaeum sp. Harcht-Bsk1]
MRVIVVGAGEVGRTIATNLADSHEVVVVELDPELVDELTYAHDVLAIEGDGTDVETLREAGIEDADMLIASTDDDEANIVTCGAAKTISDAFTVARVKRHRLLETWRGAPGAFGVDFMVCTDLLAAQAIFRIAGLPGAQDVDAFAGGLIRMAEFEIREDSPVANQTVSEADRWESLTFAAIFRDGDVVVPSGVSRIQSGDRIVVIGSPENIRDFAEELAAEEDAEHGDIVIVGGSKVGHQTARVFEEHGKRPRLIEQNPDRARELAEILPDTMVLNNDATDREFLERESVGDADLVVACLDSDEKNLLVSLLAKRMGAERAVTVVSEGSYTDLFETVGVDVAVSPREETAEEIVRFTRAGRTEKVAMLEGDLAEVIEFEVDESSNLAGRTIVESTSELPDGIVVGAISRGGSLVTPRGDTVIQNGDHVVVFVDNEVLDTVLDLL